MRDFQTDYEAFMKVLEDHAASLPFSFSEYPIDHACYRMATQKDYEEICAEFKNLSSEIVNAPHHGRNFHIFVLSKPLTYKNTKVSCIEVSEPGGSDNYPTGFQHIEFLTKLDLQKAVTGNKNLEPFLFTGKFGDEIYLKWPDKLALKFTATPVLEKSKSKEDSEVIKKIPTY
jgi:predicted metalloenzyme YecM